MYTIEYALRVEDSMKKLPKHDRKAIYETIDDLRKDPRPSGIEPLQGNLEGYFRVRYGNYRIIYSIHDDKLIVYVVKVAKRGEAYK